MKIKFQKILDNAIIPRYAYKDDAGMDVFSAEKIILKAGERKKNGIGKRICFINLGQKRYCV